jgi:hypothetical protein
VTAPVAPEVSRKLTLSQTYRGKPRAIVATLAHGDRITFALEGVEDIAPVSLPLRELFWQAIRGNPGREKHPLQPRSCKGAQPKKRGRKPDTHFAKQYGVSTGTVAQWRRSGAPLSDPDRMGDYIFKLPKRRK